MEKFIKILQEALCSDASDLHIKSGCYPMLRCSGVIRTTDKFDVVAKEELLSFIQKIMDAERFEHFLKSREIDFASQIVVNGQNVRMRINAFYALNEPSIAIRIVKNNIPTVEELGLPCCLIDFVKRRSGLLLATGPTGCGKSTTLAALAEELNKNCALHIVTVEDPIEYVYTQKKALIHQREVGRDTPDAYTAIRSVLRQDPDVIVIGEMRDRETISAALTAAETGHLVLGTLHTNNACQTIDRIIDSYDPNQQQQIRLQLSEVLICVVSQILLNKKDKTGMIPATELLIVNNAVRNLIREAKTSQIENILQTSSKLGMHRMSQDIDRLIKENMISEHERETFLS